MLDEAEQLESVETPVEPTVGTNHTPVATRRKTGLDRIIASDGELPNDLAELEDLLSQEVFDITNPSFVRSIEKREEPVKKKIERQREATRQRPQWTTTARNRQLGARDTVSFLWATIFVVFAPFIGMILLYFTEAHAVYLGIVTFMPNDMSFASLMAIALVTFYFSIEWWSAGVKHRNAVTTPQKSYRFTLLMFWKKLKYLWAGDGGQYQEVVKQKRNWLLNATLITLMLLIVVLGILGRLGDLIGQQEGIWHQALVTMVTQSNLKEFLEYFGGGFIAIALLVSTHFLVNYIYMTYVSAVGSDEVDFFDSASAQAQLDAVRVQVYRWKLMQIRQQKEEALMLTAGQNTNLLPTTIAPSIINVGKPLVVEEESSRLETSDLLSMTDSQPAEDTSQTQHPLKPKIKRVTPKEMGE